MRIIAGRLRGRKFDAPPGRVTRPITDRAKESIFNILGSRLDCPGGLPPLDVLDIFAGSGAMGIEALSRGARSCVFIERDRAAIRTLRQNLAALQITEAAKIAPLDGWSIGARSGEYSGRFGLIFADPPYRDARDAARVGPFSDQLATLLAPGGLMVFRQELGGAMSAAGHASATCIDERRYGRMHILVFTRASAG